MIGKYLLQGGSIHQMPQGIDSGEKIVQSCLQKTETAGGGLLVATSIKKTEANRVQSIT